MKFLDEVCQCAPNFSTRIIRQSNSRKILINERMTLPPRPATCVTFKVDPGCASFCKENGTALPKLPSRDLIGFRAVCAGDKQNISDSAFVNNKQRS